MILLKRILCAIGWHQWREIGRTTWRIGDGHPSRWRKAGVYDVEWACSCCAARKSARLYRSKTAKRHFERARE